MYSRGVLVTGFCVNEAVCLNQAELPSLVDFKIALLMDMVRICRVGVFCIIYIEKFQEGIAVI